MKRTKKSLIIAPALGVLLLASVGSVSGTVAWFSSVSQFDTSISQFAVTQLDGNLDCVMTPIAAKGTVAGASDNTVAVKANAKMTHASYDHVTQKLFTVSSENANGYREVTDNWVARSSSPEVYWAVSWQMTFSYDFGEETKANLFLDTTASVVRLSATADSAAKETIKGFRIAFVGLAAGASGSATTTGSTTVTRIWANQQASASCKYFDNTTVAAAISAGTYNAGTYMAEGTGGTAYASGIVNGSDNKVARPAEGTTTTIGGENYLGQFLKNGSTQQKLDFVCVAWFEGLDVNVMTGARMDSLIASMKFYTRESSN